MRLISSLIMIILLFSTVVSAAEQKPRNFWTEFDIIFFQTLPFATLYGYFIERGLSSLMYPGQLPRWNVILAFAVTVSLGNALDHAWRAVKVSTVEAN